MLQVWFRSCRVISNQRFFFAACITLLLLLLLLPLLFSFRCFPGIGIDYPEIFLLLLFLFCKNHPFIRPLFSSSSFFSSPLSLSLFSTKTVACLPVSQRKGGEHKRACEVGGRENGFPGREERDEKCNGN